MAEKRGPRKRATLSTAVHPQLRRLHKLAEKAKVPNAVLMAHLRVSHTTFYFWLRGASVSIDDARRVTSLADKIERLLERGVANISGKLKQEP